MIDQYGYPIPADLVTLPDYIFLSDEERKIVMDSDWWECNGILLWADERGIGGDSPLDAGLKMDKDGNIETGRKTKVYRVDDCLKRGSEEDNWYHV